MKEEIDINYKSNEFKVSLNTEQGQVSFKTRSLKGFLNSLIIESNNPVELLIESELGYLIIHRRQHEGVGYYCPRNRTTTPIEDMRDSPSFEKFILNESLIITILGQRNTDVTLIMRFD